MSFSRFINFPFRHISTTVFICGFITDMLLLPHGDEQLTKYLGLMWIVLLAVAIAIREIIVSLNRVTKLEAKLYDIISFFIVFFSGSALSFVYVHSLRSAEFSVSWPLIIILTLIIVINEMVSSHVFRFMLDVGVFITVTLLNSLVIAPFFFGAENEYVFYITIAISASICFFYVYILQTLSDTARVHTPKGYSLTIGIPLIITMLYSNGLIPTLAITQKDGEVYSNMENNNPASATKGKRSILTFFRPLFIKDSVDSSGLAYYSILHAPVGMKASIIHKWERYNSIDKRWELIFQKYSDITIGDSRKGIIVSHFEKIVPGTWRVTTLLNDKQIMGREKFIVK